MNGQESQPRLEGIEVAMCLSVIVVPTFAISVAIATLTSNALWTALGGLVALGWAYIALRIAFGLGVTAGESLEKQRRTAGAKARRER